MKWGLLVDYGNEVMLNGKWRQLLNGTWCQDGVSNPLADEKSRMANCMITEEEEQK
jgi:hypothetical protein